MTSAPLLERPSHRVRFVATALLLTVAAFLLTFYVQLVQGAVARGAMSRYSFETPAPRTAGGSAEVVDLSAASRTTSTSPVRARRDAAPRTAAL